MVEPLRRARAGEPDLRKRLAEVLESTGVSANRDLLLDMLTTVVRMGADGVDRLNLKMTRAALREMRQAFKVFAPYRETPKVTVFGSARTLADDPLYLQARVLAQGLAEAGWMVVTGAGPGIMAAATAGAGPDQSIGVRIRLPFEEEANALLASDPKLVTMKYFFTRKLMLMKESAGFVVLPGGFGTLDEVFELLTLLQTGKAAPAPLVLLDVPGGTYWRSAESFIRTELVARGLVDEQDTLLYLLTDSVEAAVAEVLGFYRNYHSLRYVGDTLVIRMRAAPSEDELAELDRRFADICREGGLRATPPLPAEVADRDHLHLARLALAFDRSSHGRLRALIDALNRLPTAPPLAAPDAAAMGAAGTPPDTGDRELPEEEAEGP
jgi:uncharacterized protein (TIGR00730 family)